MLLGATNILKLLIYLNKNSFHAVEKIKFPQKSFLYFYVWPPDIFSSKKHKIIRITSAESSK